jgi:hypothetical protein
MNSTKLFFFLATSAFKIRAPNPRQKALLLYGGLIKTRKPERHFAAQ